MPAPAFLVGEDVSLHAWEEDDVEFFQEHRNRREVRQPLTDVSPRNRNQVEEQFEERLYEDDDSLAFLVCTGPEEAAKTGDADELTRVGEVAIPWVNQPHASGMLMYWCAPDQQGNGYITEATELLLDHAFGQRRLHKVWAMVVEPNVPSQTVLENLGFTHEGTDRRSTYYDGEWVDSRRYGILAEDWFADE